MKIDHDWGDGTRQAIDDMVTYTNGLRYATYVMPRKDLVEQGLLVPFQAVDFIDGMEDASFYLPNDDLYPPETHPFKVVHSDNKGYLMLLLDEADDDSTIIVESIDFEEVYPSDEELSQRKVFLEQRYAESLRDALGEGEEN